MYQTQLALDQAISQDATVMLFPSVHMRLACQVHNNARTTNTANIATAMIPMRLRSAMT